jgi:hypothetical protein
MQYYERSYEKVQDVFSSLGGLCKTLISIAELINFIVNRYIKLFDTQIYMNEIENSKVYDKNILKYNSNKSLVRINVNINQNCDKSSPPKNSNSQVYDSSNKTRLYKNEIATKNIRIQKIKTKRKKNNTFVLKATIPTSNSLKNINPISFEKSTNENNKEKNISQSNDNIIKNESNDINDKNQNNNFLKFWQYLSYLISLKKYHSNIKIYSDFRKKMISEENIILNHLNIDKILQKYKSENALTF